MKQSVFYGKAERRAEMYRVQVVIPSHESGDELGISDEEYERQAELGLVDSEDEETGQKKQMYILAAMNYMTVSTSSSQEIVGGGNIPPLLLPPPPPNSPNPPCQGANYDDFESKCNPMLSGLDFVRVNIHTQHKSPASSMNSKYRRR
ncbi:unnamed protein product [Leuciscus chuanchicus]